MHYLGEMVNIYNILANIFRTLSTKLYQNWPGFVGYVTKNIWCVLELGSSNCCSLTKCKCKFHKSNVATLFR